jgi:hypothetical protein
VSTVGATPGGIRNAVPPLFPEPVPEPPPEPLPEPLPGSLPTWPPAPCAGGLSVGVGDGPGPVLVVPDAAGLDGGGEGVGDVGGTMDAVGVGVLLGVGVGVAECLGELVVGRPESDVDPVADVFGVVAVVLPGDRPVVGAGDCVAPGVGGVLGSWVRSAATTLPTITSSTSATRAIRGSEGERRRRRTPPVPGVPGIGNGAVTNCWKGSASSGGAPPESSDPPDSRAPLAAALPGPGTAAPGAVPFGAAPFDDMGAPG